MASIRRRPAQPAQLTRLSHGLRVVLKEDHSTPIVSCCLYLPGGGRDETVRTAGLTVFAQRLLLKGTGSLTAEEVVRKLESMGANITPFAGKDFVGCTLTCLRKHWDASLGLLVECLADPAFRSEEVEMERQNLLVELREHRDNPLPYALERSEEALFRGHFYGLPQMGEEESLSGVTRDQLVKWHSSTYLTGDAVISVVGDISSDTVIRQVSERFRALPRGQGTRGNGRPPSSMKKQQVVRESRDKRQCVIVMAFQAPRQVSDDNLPFEVMQHVLAGMGSRLFIELRDRQGLAYVVSSRYEGRRLAGAFKAFIGTSPEKEKVAFKAMQAELGKIYEKKVPGGELARAKRLAQGLHLIGMQRNLVQASRYGYYEAVGLGYKAVDRYPEMIGKISADDVQKVAAKYLEGGACSTVVVTPTG